MRIGRVQRIIRALKLLYIMVDTCLYKLVQTHGMECTKSRVSPNVNYKLWVIMMYEYSSLNLNKGTTPVGNIDSVGKSRHTG